MAQWAFAVLVIWYASRSLTGQWSEVGTRLRDAHPDWRLVAAASGLMLLSYVILIEGWRLVIGAWSARLARADAAAIWLASNLGKYVPGKIWSVLAMGLLARARGASPVAATGSSLLMQVASIVTGLALAAALGPSFSHKGAWVVVVAIAGVITLVFAQRLFPRLATIASKLSGRDLAVSSVPARAVWIAAICTLLAWVTSGYAFQLIARSIGYGDGPTSAYVATYAASYVAGFLALFAPGGIGVREGALVATMQRAGLATPAEAAAIAIASRLWLTVLELVPGGIALALSRKRMSFDSGAVKDAGTEISSDQPERFK